MKKHFRILLVGSIGLLSMANQKCEKKPAPGPVVPQQRELKRKVQMGPIQAPQVMLPPSVVDQRLKSSDQYFDNANMRVFDLAFVANAQVFRLLDGAGFTTSGIDPSFDYVGGVPSDPNDEAEKDFFQCQPKYSSPQAKLSLEGAFEKPLSKVVSNEAACLINYPQGILHGQITGYDFSGSNGFSLHGTITSGIGVSGGFESIVDTYKMGAEMQLVKPGFVAQGNEVVAFGDAIVESKSKGLKVDAMLGLLGFGYSNYKSTPIFSVVEDSLTRTLASLRQRWQKKEPWYSYVLNDCDQYAYINAGNETNLLKGDIVKMIEVQRTWAGEACKSRIQNELPNDDIADALACGEVKYVGRNISKIRILKGDEAKSFGCPYLTQSIPPGSIASLVVKVEDRKDLKKAAPAQP